MRPTLLMKIKPKSFQITTRLSCIRLLYVNETVCKFHVINDTETSQFKNYVCSVSLTVH